MPCLLAICLEALCCSGGLTRHARRLLNVPNELSHEFRAGKRAAKPSTREAQVYLCVVPRLDISLAAGETA